MLSADNPTATAASAAASATSPDASDVVNASLDSRDSTPEAAPGKTEHYEVEKLLSHYITPEGVTKFRAKWKYWPECQSELITYEDLKESAGVLVTEYLQQFGIEKGEGQSEEEFVASLPAKLKDTALTKETTVDNDVKLVEVVAVRHHGKDGYLYTSVWSNGDVIDRPHSSFNSDEQEAVIQKYLAMRRALAPKREKKKKNEHLATGTRSRPNAIRVKEEVMDDDEAGPSGLQEQPNKLRKIKLHAPPIKKTSKKAISKKKKEAAVTKAPKARSRQPAAKKILGFFRNSKDEDWIVLETNGREQKKKFDEEFKENPDFVFDAMREKLFRH